MKSFLPEENKHFGKDGNVGNALAMAWLRNFSGGSGTAGAGKTQSPKPPPPMELNLFTLRFNRSCAALEPLFRAAYFREALSHIRIAILMAIAIWSAYSMLDAVLAPNATGLLLLLRLGIVVPYAAVQYLLSFSSSYHKYYQLSLSSLIATAGIVVVLMILVAPPPAHYLYYAGINLVLFFGFTLLKIRFVWASATALLVLGVYEALTLSISTIPAVFLISNSAFIIGSVAMGMLASYFIEFYTRKNFFLKYLLEIEQRKLAGANRNLEKRVRERTRALQNSNRSLAESEERLSTIFNSVESGIIIIDAENCIIADVNSTAAGMIGIRKGDIVGRHCHEFICDKGKDHCPMNGNGNMVAHKEDTLMTRSGESVPILKTAIPIILNGRRHFIESFLSLKQLKETEAEKRKLEEQLIQTQKLQALGTLAGGIAHDFNNILFGMIGYTELTLDELSQDSDGYDHLQEVLKGANRASELVNQILTFSRQADQERKPIRIVPLVKEALKLLRATMPTTIAFKEMVDPKTHMVFADPTQVHQVMMNICTNANHAMRKNGGTLEVRLSNARLDRKAIEQHENLTEGSYVCLRIKDTGHGMTPDVMARIFDPFYTTKTQGEGTGMGLSVVHGIIKSHGGAIRVKSAPGIGTVFTIYLPAIETKLAEPLITKTVIPRGEERILVVDDESGLVRMEKQLLSALGYQVTGMTSSRDALELFQTDPHQFELVITDLTMPEMTGIELSEAMLKIRADLPIVICTGFSSKKSEEKAKSIGIRAFITKPIEKHELAMMVREALEIPN